MIFYGRSIADNHICYSVDTILALIGVEYNKHSTIAIRHRAKLLELLILAWHNLTLIDDVILADVARIIVS